MTIALDLNTMQQLLFRLVPSRKIRACALQQAQLRPALALLQQRQVGGARALGVRVVILRKPGGAREFKIRRITGILMRRAGRGIRSTGDLLRPSCVARIMNCHRVQTRVARTDLAGPTVTCTS